MEEELGAMVDLVVDKVDLLEWVVEVGGEAGRREVVRTVCEVEGGGGDGGRSAALTPGSFFQQPFHHPLIVIIIIRASSALLLHQVCFP